MAGHSEVSFLRKGMVSMKSWLIKNWILLSSGLLMTAEFVKVAYEERGYVAFGGEWLVLPIMILLKVFVRDFIKEVWQWL